MTRSSIIAVALLFTASATAEDPAPQAKTSPKESSKSQAARSEFTTKKNADLPPLSPLEAELKKANEELRELRESHKLNHPAVQAKLRAVLVLQAKLAQRDTSPATVSELQKAREELDVLRITMKEKHPAVQAQLRKIAELETQQRASTALK